MNNPFVGFVPWIIFWVVAAPSTWEYATLGALIAAVILAVPDAQKRSLKLLDVTTIAFFAVFSLLAVFLDPADLDWLEDYSQAISSGVLAVIVLELARLRPVHRAVRARVRPARGLGHTGVQAGEPHPDPGLGPGLPRVRGLGVIAQNVDSGKDWLNWIFPIILIVGAFKFTARYPDQVRERAGLAPRSEPGNA